MIIHSPVSPEIIWQDLLQGEFQLVEDIIDGIQMQILITPDSTARIERILSTDPRHYLNSAYQPGSYLIYQRVAKCQTV